MLLHTIRLKLILRVFGPSMSLSIMHSSDQFLKRFLQHWLQTIHSLVLQAQIHSTLMTNILFYVNGVQHPSEPLCMHCSSPFGARRAYETLFSSTGILHDDRAHMITFEIFTKCFQKLRFDLTPVRKADEEHISATSG